MAQEIKIRTRLETEDGTVTIENDFPGHAFHEVTQP